MRFNGVQIYSNVILKWQKDLNRLFKGIISFLVVSSLFIAINALLATYFSYLLLNITINLKLVLSVFFIMFSIYSLNKLTDAKEDAVNLPERTSYIQGNRRLIALLSMFSCLIALILGFSVSFLSIFILLFPFIIGIFYSIQISPKLPRLKNITGVKNFMVAISWAVTVSLLPETYLHNICIIVSLIFYFILVKFFINTVIFDIRDIEGDRKNNIKTIPVVIGRQKTKKMLLIIHSTLIPWLAVSIYWGFFTRYLPVLIFCIIYGYWYIHYFCNTEKVPKYATDLLVDGEWIFVAALCFIITII